MKFRWFPLPLLSLLGCALLLGACGGDDSDSGSEDSTSTATTTEDTTAVDSQSDAGQGVGGAGADDGAIDLYFTSGEQFRKVERDIPDGSPQEQAEALTEALLAGPTKKEAATKVPTASQIPDGTTLEDVAIDGDAATVSVSSDFAADVPGVVGNRDRAERSDIDARLAQVTYTLTQLDGIQSVKVVAGGEPVESSPVPGQAPVSPRAAQRRNAFAKPSKGPQSLDRPRGERSASVRALQERLAELKYLPKKAVDGVDGYRTQQAVLAFQSWRGLDRDGVVGPATRAALDKASPPRPHGDGPSKRIEVYREKGVTLLIKNDRTKRAIHVSTGGPGNETPSGTYEVFRKELRSWSVPFQVWLPYASYFNNGIAFHEYPDVPTYPASHGCVRVPAPEAPGVYKFAAMGTTVIVF